MLPVVLLWKIKPERKRHDKPCLRWRGKLSDANQALYRESIVFAVMASLLACNSCCRPSHSCRNNGHNWQCLISYLQ